MTNSSTKQKELLTLNFQKIRINVVHTNFLLETEHELKMHVAHNNPRCEN